METSRSEELRERDKEERSEKERGEETSYSPLSMNTIPSEEEALEKWMAADSKVSQGTLVSTNSFLSQISSLPFNDDTDTSKAPWNLWQMKGRESEQDESDHIQEEEERRLTHSPLPSGSE